MPRRLSPGLEREVRRLAAKGHTLREIGAMVERSKHAVSNILARAPRAPTVQEWNPSSARLSLREREEIRAGLERGLPYTAIARGIRRAVSTVSREVAANGGRGRYAAWRAHERAALQARRPKPRKLAHAPLAAQVIAWLEQWWSPEAIAQRLRREFPYDPRMRVSHETIYQALFVQGRGELRRELHRCLRSGRARRRPRSRLETRGTIPDMVMVSERPAEVTDRAVPGHWEGDLLSGAHNRSAVGTLVERTTRYLLLLHLPDGRGAGQVNAAMRRAIQSLPAALRRSITWDQGKEMLRHVEFTMDTGIQIYFCDPHSPWQRGSNENTNGLLRQYFPKGTALTGHTTEDLARVAESLNSRPRKTLGFMTPSEKLAELLAMTA
jgi:transposase, IS30 family